MRNSNFNDENYTSSSGGSNLLFLLAGCGIGATLGLLFAPKAGSELRSDISDVTRKGYDETLELAGAVKDHSADLYQSIRQSADRVYDLAATKLQLAEKALEDSKQMAGDLVNGEINGKSGKTSSQGPSPKEPGSNIY